MKINFDYTKSFYNTNDYIASKNKVCISNKLLKDKSSVGNDYLGWIDYPNVITNEYLDEINEYANKIRNESKALVVIGIGGSYLGARSAIEMLSSYYKRDIEIIYVGNNMSSSYLYEVLDRVKDIDFSINVISKSGSTIETCIAFRLFLNLLLNKYKNNAYDRIYVVTEDKHNNLNKFSINNNIKTFYIPFDIGGRYSVLTAAGLFPIAVSGVNIYKIIEGARAAYNDMLKDDNVAIKYATLRYMFYSIGYDIEILSSFEPKMHYFIEWYKQLFAESEGKDHKGLFPTGAIFSTDLHSIGQMIQDGKRNIIETIININNPSYDLCVCDISDLDDLDYITGISINQINNDILKATIKAHKDGGVPVISIDIDCINEFNHGYLAYFFMYSCALSAYTIGVNPFNQPGVESYKKNMYTLLESEKVYGK